MSIRFHSQAAAGGPYRVEYLCSYRPVWRWDGQELEHLEEALGQALSLVAAGRPARVIDGQEHIIWTV